MIYFDTTKARSARHKSGLVRVSSCLREALGSQATSVEWKGGCWWSDGGAVAFKQDDWLLTPELFSEEERPGMASFLEGGSVKTAAIFHDALPMKLPHVTWAKSVARHPSYMKLLASFDRVFAVSRSSAAELEGYWRWLGKETFVSVTPIQLGVDQRRLAGGGAGSEGAVPTLLQVGIVEPRKNQDLTLSVCERLWDAGHRFNLRLIGRVNPEFGEATKRRIDALSRAGRPVCHEASADDETLAAAYAGATLLLFPSLGEGCGLPLLEALSFGLPCVCPDLPVFRETAAGGGCVCVAGGAASWEASVRKLLTDLSVRQELRAAAMRRKVPSWEETASEVLKALSLGE